MKLRQWCMAALCAALLSQVAWAAQAEITVTGWTVSWPSAPLAEARVNADLAVQLAEAQAEATEIDTGYQESLQEYPDTMMYSYRSETAPAVETDRYLVMRTWEERYCGGAHGDYGEYYVVYDKHTGHRVSVSQLAGELPETLHPKLEHLTVSELERRDITDFSIWGEYIHDLFAPDAEINYTLTEDGHVELVFNPYEVGPYMLGIVRIEVPSEMIAPVK